jgi:hypothetical protein
MRRLTVAVLLFLPILAEAQGGERTPASTSPTEYYINLYTASNGAVASTTGFMTFVERLETKRASLSDNHEFVRYLFYKTHQKVLRHYRAQTTFDRSLSRGEYNCLTGTAVYGMLLSHFGIPYKIVETNYHIFILAETNKGQVLLEATDPMNGFADQPAAIEKRIATYRQNDMSQAAMGKKGYVFSFDLYNEVTLDQLLGLLHYNLAVDDYNRGEIQQALTHLDKALDLYSSPRIEEFTRVMQYTVVCSTMEAPAKTFYVKKIQSLRKKRMLVMASASAK